MRLGVRNPECLEGKRIIANIRYCHLHHSPYIYHYHRNKFLATTFPTFVTSALRLFSRLVRNFLGRLLEKLQQRLCNFIRFLLLDPMSGSIHNHKILIFDSALHNVLTLHGLS